MDDVARRKPVSSCDPRLAGRAAADPATLLQKLRPGGTVDCSVDTASAEQALVRSVDDRIERKRRDVGDDDAEHQSAVQPPSIECVVPVICEAASEQRKTVSAADVFDAHELARRLALQHHLLDDAVARQIVHLHLVGDLTFDERRQHVARADGVGR